MILIMSHIQMILFKYSFGKYSKNIIHCDLNPNNVLEDENYYPKLTDFGSAKFIGAEKSEHSDIIKIGTPLYMAPESLNDDIYSNASDVYSYAFIAYELVTNEKPFGNIKSNFKIIDKINQGERPEFTKPIPNCFKNLITQCLSHDRNKRPAFTEIIDMLKNDPQFINEFDDDENEYKRYIKIVSGEIPYPHQSISEKQEQLKEIIEDDNKPLLINIENKTNKMTFAAKISKSEIYECLKKEIDTVNLIREVTILSKINHPARISCS